MQISLHSILTHQSFDWTCRRTQAALLENMVVVVREMTKMEMVATDSSSILYKAMVKLYHLVKKPKNVRQGFETFMKQESEVLESYMLVFGEEATEDELQLTDDVEDGMHEEENEDGNEDIVKRRKYSERKSYGELKTVRLKKARVANVMEVIKKDAGLGEDVLQHLLMEQEDSSDKNVTSEAFKMCCLSLMKTLRLSDTKYDDLRWWIEDVTQRGFDISSMPTARTLKEKVMEEMIPPNMETCETGARFALKGTLFHQGERIVERSDIKMHLREGDTLVHLAKVGSDFQTGLGKMSQKKESDFDEDGSHNSAFQTLKLSCGDQTLFLNKAPGGTELLRIFSKTTNKDTQEKIIEEMEALDSICKERPVQEIIVKDVGKVFIQHHLVNCLHDGKERLVMAQHKVARYLEEGVVKKPSGFGHPGKVSTQTCQVCLTDPKTYNQEQSLSADPVLFPDIKNYSLSPLHMRMRVFEATWNAAIDLHVSLEPCTRLGQPCTLHPYLYAAQKVPGVKSPRACACDAKENIKKRFQREFQERLGLRCFYPEPKGGNSNTGNLATRVFQNSAVSASIFQIPESLLLSLWELLKAVSSSEFQDIDKYKEDAR